MGITTLLVQCKSGDNPSAGNCNNKPNIIYILADDLGYGDLGVYGQTKAETPNIDKLAANGMLFTRHYSGSAVCAPSRCVLLTGLHSGHSQIRSNEELKERGDVWDHEAMLADSTLEGQLPLIAGTVTLAKLMQQGGYKTGMFGKWGLGPPDSESIPTKMGFDYFFGINCQRMAHTYYPPFLYENDHRVYLKNKEYSPDLMFKELTAFVNRNKRNPFFLYWATPLPHSALQAPQKWIDYYVDKFGDEQPYLNNKGAVAIRYPHATYAAMISYLDENVGILVQQLKDLGIYENTLIIFTSDNGSTDGGGRDSQWFNSGGPFRWEKGYNKGSLYEGGIRAPMIASWPCKIKPGSVSDLISAFWDVLPTCCDIAGIKAPDNTDGISFLPELTGKKQKKHDFLYWEFPSGGGQQAVITGNFKALRKNLNIGSTEFELYNLKEDIKETTNIAALHPEILQKVEMIGKKEHVKSQYKQWVIKGLEN